MAMHKSPAFILVLFLAIAANADQLGESRLELVKVLNVGERELFVVFHNKAGTLRWTTAEKTLNAAMKKIFSSKWQNLPLPGGLKMKSNPTAITTKSNHTYVYGQAVNGQVYSLMLTATQSPKFGSWVMIGGSKLPWNQGAELKGQDSVKAIVYANKPYVLSRSITNASRCYWTSMDATGKWSAWSLLGGKSAILMTDVSLVYNSFSKYLEAFTVMTDGYMYRTWQTGFSDWHSWDKTGYYAPKSLHAPVAHAMDTNLFNGRINVFVHGTDDKVHHIWQTTCDKVPNPWGWCTWSTWNTIGDGMPLVMNVANTLSIANNMHLGIEVFTVDKKGKLLYMWQAKRHGKWNKWSAVSTTQSDALTTLANVMDDKTGWWVAFGLDSSDRVFFIEENRSFSVTPNKIVSGQPVEVKWSVPVDQATHMDWIAVYKHGESSYEYVDFYYVGGTQNPYKDPVPKGQLKFVSYLPAGTYDYRYLVNKRYVPAIQTSLVVSKGPSDVDWVQVFRGLFTGFQLKNISVETCVKDGEGIADHFQQAFVAFEDREIYKGLHLMGYGLGNALSAMKDCKIESVFVKGIEKFIADLKSCIEGSCVHFAIDSIKEIVILFENIYEIYGDILSASNSFKIKAYEQGGFNVGRMVNACLAGR
eukprot:gene20371-22380_t